MKIKILTLLIICLSLDGCSRKCDGYAPEGSEISWTDYNSVRDVHGYFMYKKTADQHKNDTVRICGYIIGSNDTNYYRSEYYEVVDEGRSNVRVFISDDPTFRFNSGMDRGKYLLLGINGTLEQMEWLLDYKAGQKVYVTGFCYAVEPEDDKGCSWLTYFNISSVYVEK